MDGKRSADVENLRTCVRPLQQDGRTGCQLMKNVVVRAVWRKMA